MGITNDETHYLRCIFRAGKPDDLAVLATALDMREGYVEPERPDERCDDLEGKQNGGSYFLTKGDFSVMLSANIWNWTSDQIDTALLTASTRGIAVAVPDDEGDVPDFPVYISGRRIRAVLEHDEVFDDHLLIRPKSERQNLPRPDKSEDIKNV
ncbi:hypothetical protein [Roseobacter weihaiensis]|uniref:hypothetical protein n=1 Tax=Roseobacter weihaiensis TaxID=2763262 RepID=UPI001D0B3A79|nr:hypothetical protein [Roseobacter sp. H9]